MFIFLILLFDFHDLGEERKAKNNAYLLLLCVLFL